MWGSGPCLGCGPDTVSLRPRLLDELHTVNIHDIVCGDSHCLALTVGLYHMSGFLCAFSKVDLII